MRRNWWRGAACATVTAAVVMGTAAVAGAAASSATDEQIAAAGVLTETDFPAGWTSSPNDSSNGEETEEVARTIPSCKRYLSLRAMGKKQPRAESPSFELGNSDIQNTVAVFRSNASANAAMKVLRHSSVLTCVNELFTEVYEAELASNPTTRDAVADVAVDIENANIGQVGDAAHAYEGTVTVTMNDGSEQTIGVGIAAVRADRAVSIYTYLVDSEAVLALLPTLVDESMARLDAALA